MCLLEPLPSIIVTPNAMSPEIDHLANIDGHFERLLVTATIVSTMRNVQYNDDSAQVLNATCSTPHDSGSSKLGQICSFLLGGPMPPAPGLIPLCWEELLDWAEDSTSLTEDVIQRTTAINLLCGSSGELETTNSINRRIRFVPYVSVHETDATLKKLASQTYMARARFYQESVRPLFSGTNTISSHFS
jgi:hypothetical protein